MEPSAGTNKRAGVLVMAYGTPGSPAEIESYYTHIRRGRPPAPEQLAELVARYEAIGGLSPLRAITERQAKGLQIRLRETDPSVDYQVFIGMKHARPFIGETVEAMKREGIGQAAGIVLAPHYSSMSVGSYIEYAQEAAELHGGPVFQFVRSWHLEPDFIESTALRIKQALSAFSPAERGDVQLIFTAHSLPERILKMGDPYADQIAETARAVAERLQHEKWICGWQSAGRTPEPWLGPDILELLKQLQKSGVRQALICPVGFVSDHLEVLYDIDIEAQALASQLGIQLGRSASPNDEPLFLQAMANAVIKQIAEGQQG